MIFPTSLQVLAHTDELTPFATYQVFQTNPGKRRIAVGERHIHIISYKNEKESPNVSSHVSVHCVFCAFCLVFSVLCLNATYPSSLVTQLGCLRGGAPCLHVVYVVYLYHYPRPFSSDIHICKKHRHKII